MECGDCGNPHLEDVDVITDSPDGISRAYIACGAGRVSVRLDDLQVWAIDFDRNCTDRFCCSTAVSPTS